MHLTPDNEGNLPPSALIPFCSYQGESSLLRQTDLQIDNLTTCNLFEPKILEGQLCYSLNIAQLNVSAKSGKSNGLFLLIDQNPFQLNNTDGNVQGLKDQPFKVFIKTIAQFTTFGPGSYAINALKKMTGTKSFTQLPQDDKGCLVHDREDCQTQKYLDHVKTYCKCVPWPLQNEKEEIEVKLSFILLLS